MLTMVLALALVAQVPDGEAAKDTPAVVDDSTGAFAARTKQPFSFGLDAALDVPAHGLWPMASARLDFRYRMPVLDALTAELGLRGGYSYRAGKGPVTDAALGVDQAAFLVAHTIPLYAVAGVSFGSGEPSAFGIPLRLSTWAGPGVALAIGNAQAFGRRADVLAIAPAGVFGLALEVLQTPELRYGIVVEGELIGIEPGVPALAGDLSALRLGLTVSYAFGS